MPREDFESCTRIADLSRNSIAGLLLTALVGCGASESGTTPQPNTPASPQAENGSAAVTPSPAEPPATDVTPETAAEPPATDATPETASQPTAQPQPQQSPIERAISSGDASHIDNADDLLDATLASIESGRTLHTDTLISLFDLGSDGSAKPDGSSLTRISWNPTHDAATLVPAFGENATLLYTNSVTQSDKTAYQKSIAVIGESASRYLVFGGNPMRNYRRSPDSLNAQMHQLLQNSLTWLTARNDLATTGFNVTIANVANNFYFPDEQGVREWLDEFYPNSVNYNDAGSCDDTLLASCLTDTDLLVISQDINTTTDVSNLANTVKNAMQNGLPVLYLHLDGGLTDLGAALLPLFNVGYEWDNYWKNLQLDSIDVRDTLGALADDIASVATLLRHLRQRDFNFDWSACNAQDCSLVPGLDSQVQYGADYVRSLMTNLDSAKRNLFDEPGFEFQKLLALSGDHLRQSTSHPMDKQTTNDTTFMRAWFADHAVYHYRNINPAQPDMGNFSRSDFSHITPQSKTVNLTSKRNFRSAGVYALPGQPVTVTRLDQSDLTVKIFVNTQRSGSTHQWASDGYNRPKYLQSPHFAIEPGETIRFTSPYGGPLQVAFSDNDLAVSLQFNNIGQHPYWSGPQHDASFTAQLSSADYDWAELVTPGFEVHSSVDKMRTSIADEKWGTAQLLAAGTMRYLHNFPHVLAGFQGPGIDVVDEIHTFASTNGYTIDLLDLVKHMNADQATCGYGCSGNPYDAYWSFSPVGHGDVHELGHGLEKRRLRFEGWELHTMTNPYSYYTKTQYFKTTGDEPECQSLPFESTFNVLRASINSEDPAAYVKSNLWDVMGWSEGAAMFIQMMMSAEDHGALEDGWHLLARLHIMEREFNRAIAQDDTSWLAARASFGMEQYTRSQAEALSLNDWLLIAVSFATGFDHRDYFDMWALPYSAAAQAQLSALGYPPIARNFYISSASGYCTGEGFDGLSIALDGEQRWPE